MDLATYNKGKDLVFKIDRLRDFIGTVRAMRSFCNNSCGIAELPETTEAMKALILPDLEAQLKQLQALFAKL